LAAAALAMSPITVMALLELLIQAAAVVALLIHLQAVQAAPVLLSSDYIHKVNDE
jgi:hypothetical protein